VPSSLISADSLIESDKDTILITGFEPFGEHDINPSELIVEALDGAQIASYDVTGLVLPVDFDLAVEEIIQAIENIDPIFVISIGLDETTTTIDVEKIALNLKRYARNETPLWFIPRLLSRGDPFFQFSPLNARDIVDELTVAEIPAKVSVSAGTYVCNAVLYHSLLYCKDNALDTSTGFIHVPLLDSQSPDGLPLEMMIEAVNITMMSCLP